MDEATKTKLFLTKKELLLLNGKGIDIGCGKDPITETCERFDIDDGNANRITDFVKGGPTYDFVFSAHCLEHMYCPPDALRQWFSLVKPGGVMIIAVPDEDLYEQGYWPSLFNTDHKATFTISKQQSWSPASYNILDFVADLSDCELLSARLQDSYYNRSKLAHKRWSWIIARAATIFRGMILKHMSILVPILDFFYMLLNLPIDQTWSKALAQNILIVRKLQDKTESINVSTKSF